MAVNLSDPESLFEAAQQALLQGHIAQAELMLQQATELADSSSTLYAAGLAVLLNLQGREDEGLELLGDRMEEHPEDSTLLLAFGLSMDKAEDYEAAEDAYREALQHDPDNPGALHGLAVRLKSRGETAQAEQLACKAFHQVPNHPIFARTASQLLREQNKPDLAFEVAELGATYNPDDDELVRMAVEGAIERSMPKRAWDLLAESPSDDPWVIGWKATVMELNGRFEEADALVRESMPRCGHDPTYLFLVAHIYHRQNDDRRLEVLDRLTAIDPDHAGALKLRSELLDDTHVEETIQPLEQAYEATQDALTGWELVASLYSTERYMDALNLCLKLRDDPDLPSTLFPTFAMICHAALDELGPALGYLKDLPYDMAMAAVAEMDKAGADSSAEAILRQEIDKKFADYVPEPELEPWELAAEQYANQRYQECLETCSYLDLDDEALFRIFTAFTLLAQAALDDFDALEATAQLPDDMIPSVLEEMERSGSGSSTEKQVRAVLEARQPEPQVVYEDELPPDLGDDVEVIYEDELPYQDAVPTTQRKSFDNELSDNLLGGVALEEVTIDAYDEILPGPAPQPEETVVGVEVDPDDPDYELVYVEVDEDEPPPPPQLTDRFDIRSRREP